MFIIETLDQLVQRVRRSFRINMPGSDATIWPNNVNPTAKVVGGVADEILRFADYIGKQKFALTADSENLDLHGEELGMARSPAAPARGSIDIATPVAVTVAPAAIFERIDGVRYRALVGGQLAGPGNLQIDVVAVADGVASNAIADTPLAAVSGVQIASLSGVEISVTADGVIGGSDVEDDESFRERILFRKRNTPHGGAPADYVMWCRQLSGVTRVFVERRFAGPGTVRVFPVMDDLYPGGVPPIAEIARVSDHLESLAPATADYLVAAPVARVINVTISGLEPLNTHVEEAIKAELRAMFRRQSRVSGSDGKIPSLPYLAWPETFSRSWIWQAIANSTGEERHKLEAPAGDITLAATEFPVLGEVLFI